MKIEMTPNNFNEYILNEDLVMILDEDNTLKLGELTESSNFFQWGLFVKLSENNYEYVPKNNFNPQKISKIQHPKHVPEEIINQLCEDDSFQRQYNIYQKTCALYIKLKNIEQVPKGQLSNIDKEIIHENSKNKLFFE